MIVDQIKYPSGHQFSWTSGISHTLQAKTEIIGNTTYAPAGWTDLTANVTYSDNPHTAAPIQNTTYQANFSVSSVAVTVYQNFSTGGSTGGTIGHWEGDLILNRIMCQHLFTLGRFTSITRHTEHSLTIQPTPAMRNTINGLNQQAMNRMFLIITCSLLDRVSRIV